MSKSKIESHVYDAPDATQSIVELLPFPTILLEISSEKVVAANKAAERILKIPTGVIIDRTVLNLLETGHDLTCTPWRILPRSFFYEGKTVRASVLNPSLNLRNSDEEAIELNGFIFWEMFWYSTQGMFQSTQEGRFLRVNPAFAKMLAYESPEDMINSIRKMETEFYSDPHLRGRYQARLEVSESIQGIEFEAWSKDKKRIWLSVHSRTVRDLSGKILYYEGTVDDISARKRVEEELASTHQKVLNQSAQLAYHVQELEQFSNILAHDLSAPLRMICSYLPQIESQCAGILNTRDKEFLKFVMDGAAHMKNLMSGLLRYAKTRIPPKPTCAISSKVCLKLATENLKDQIDSASAEIRWDSLPEVFIDRAMLTDIFQNIISNALKYAEVIPLLIRVSARLEGDFWIFCIADNGKGISRQDQARIFFLYQRGEEASHKEGSGIGLAICQKTITAYGGRIWVESEPEKGAAFYFSLPANIHEGNLNPLSVGLKPAP